MPLNLDIAKTQVLKRIAGDNHVCQLNRHVWQVGKHRLHIKGKSNANSGMYSFNISRSVLKNNFEVWVCGNADLYYLIPIAEIRQMYEHPDAYHDNTHPALTVVTVNPFKNTAMYASDGLSVSLDVYRCTIL